MPTYEYACKSCEERLEVVQSFTEDALTTCPSCQGALRKVFGSIGISFKGSGFYKTDSRASSSATTKPDGAAKGEGGSAKTEGGSGKTDGGDTKSDAGSKDSSVAKADTKKSDTKKSDAKPKTAAAS